MPGTSSAGISSLPDSALVHILGRLTEAERQQAALVCRRWQRAAHSPLLLRQLSLTLVGAAAPRFWARLHALAVWLARTAAPHVRELKLGLHFPGGLSDAQKQEAGYLLAGMLASCGGAGSQLSRLELTVSGRMPVILSSWLAALSPSLQKLHVAVLDAWLTVSFLPPLERLRELELGASQFSACRVALLPTVRLPTSLTRLSFANMSAEALPLQFTQLSQLADLRLDGCALASSGYAPLARLGSSLQRLKLSNCSHLPACLAELTALNRLEVHNMGEKMLHDAAGVVQAALPRLGRLTFLELSRLPGMGGPPEELASLSRLRCFAWCGPAAWDAELPTGCWLASLQQLAAPAEVLADSWQQLAAAAQLEQLGVTKVEDGDGDSAARIVRLVQHSLPSLQQLELEEADGRLPGEVVRAALETRVRRPGLYIEVTPCVFGLDADAGSA